MPDRRLTLEAYTEIGSQIDMQACHLGIAHGNKIEDIALTVSSFVLFIWF